MPLKLRAVFNKINSQTSQRSASQHFAQFTLQAGVGVDYLIGP